MDHMPTHRTTVPAHLLKDREGNLGTVVPAALVEGKQSPPTKSLGLRAEHMFYGGNPVVPISSESPGPVPITNQVAFPRIFRLVGAGS
jgi:hypothetical protein